MLSEKILIILVILVFAVVGLVACNKSAEDQIIDKKTFLKVYAQCDAASSDRVSCVVNVFDLKTNEYCANNELAPANPKCVEIKTKIKSKVTQYFTENLTDAFKK